MKAILFCANPYAFGILKPLYDELLRQNHDVLWYVPKQHLAKFTFKETAISISISDLKIFNSDAIFVPGNEVPHYLRGVKVQVFHGLAGEKKGHFRIRHYFDLYLTQGPYFTNRFKEMANRHRDFEVIETGWCKLDSLFIQRKEWMNKKAELLKQTGKGKLILYAPTFSPSLTSAKVLKGEIARIAESEDVLVLIKFHDLMDKNIVAEYHELAKSRSNIRIENDPDILKLLIISDLMISDTSSVVYEFVLLDKPVITLNSNSQRVAWKNIKHPSELSNAYQEEALSDSSKSLRTEIFREYHPYRDGKSSKRMVDAVLDYINRHGVPEERKLNWWRRYKMNKMFGKKPKN